MTYWHHIELNFIRFSVELRSISRCWLNELRWEVFCLSIETFVRGSNTSRNRVISVYRKTWTFSDKEFRPSSLTGADQKFLSRFGWQLPPSFFLLGFTFFARWGIFYTSFRRLIPIAPSCQSKVVWERYREVSDPQISVAWIHYYVVSHYLLLTSVFLSASLPISSTTDSDSL